MLHGKSIIKQYYYKFHSFLFRWQTMLIPEQTNPERMDQVPENAGLPIQETWPVIHGVFILILKPGIVQQLD